MVDASFDLPLAVSTYDAFAVRALVGAPTGTSNPSSAAGLDKSCFPDDTTLNALDSNKSASLRGLDLSNVLKQEPSPPGCYVVIVPRPALRPTLGVTWESAGAPGQALQVTLGVPDAKPDTRVSVWVVALRPGVTCPDDTSMSCGDPLYVSHRYPDAVTGTSSEVVKIPVNSTDYAEVCVGAAMAPTPALAPVAPALRCSQAGDTTPATVWVRAKVPSPNS